MGMFSRMSDIVQANINAMLDKAEDPEKVIVQAVEDMQVGAVEKMLTIATRTSPTNIRTCTTRQTW